MVSVAPERAPAEIEPPADGSESATQVRGRFRLGTLAPKTLGTRLALTYTGIALLIMVVLGWSLAGAVRDFFLDRLRTDLLEETAIAGDLIAPLITEGADADAIEALTTHIGEALDARATVVLADGTVLGDSAGDLNSMDNHAGRPEIQAAFRTGTGSSVRTSATMNEEYFFVAREIADNAAVVRLGIPLSVIDALVRDVQRRVAIAALVAAVLMTGTGLFVARRIGGAIQAIRDQVGAVASGRFDVLVEPAPTQELGDLARSFNAMTEQLRDTISEVERVRARLEATLANLSDGVIITDDRGHVILANIAATRALAVNADVVGEPFVEIARDHELTEMVNQALRTADGVQERTIRHGRSDRILQTAAQGLDAGGEHIGVIVLKDITELRRLEGVRREFVANVSHELRTPLTSIRALVETLESGAIEEPEVATDFLSRIIAEVDRLAQLVEELLELARLESGRTRLSLDVIAPETLIRDTERRIAPHVDRAQLTLSLDIAPDTPQFVADRARIDQVLLNLVHNAVKFTPAGGSITLRVAPAGDSVEFRVVDTGVGVSPDELARLFERFYKADRARHSAGTGLGLAIAKHIVQAHGGSIGAELNPEGGMVFVFRLPVSGPPAADFTDDGVENNRAVGSGLAAP